MTCLNQNPLPGLVCLTVTGRGTLTGSMGTTSKQQRTGIKDSLTTGKVRRIVQNFCRMISMDYGTINGAGLKRSASVKKLFNFQLSDSDYTDR